MLSDTQINWYILPIGNDGKSIKDLFHLVGIGVHRKAIEGSSERITQRKWTFVWLQTLGNTLYQRGSQSASQSSANNVCTFKHLTFMIDNIKS